MYRLTGDYRNAASALNPEQLHGVHGDPHPDPDAVLLVVVTDSEGLGELSAALALPDNGPVAALFTGKRPSVAAMCAHLGAADVICLDELPADELTARIDAAVGRPAWPLAALDTLPIAVAVRDEGGDLHYRNAAHRELPERALSALSADPTLPLDIEEVPDPVSGRVFLRYRVPIALAEGDGTVEVAEDITGRHIDRDEITRQRDALAAHARALSSANLELAGLDRTKSEFIALAAHELRTPLTAITTALHILRREVGGNSDKAARFLDMSERNVGRLSALADDLLEFTKLETSQIALAFGPVDLARCIDDAAAALKQDAETARVTIATDSSPTLPALQGDAIRIQQAVRNLVEGAIGRSPEGATVPVSARVLCGSTSQPLPHRIKPRPLPCNPAEWVEITVEDVGKDAVTETSAEMFDSFSPGQDPLASNGTGPSLRLAICRKIVEAHGGSVWAERRESGGTRTVIRLPRLTPEDVPLLAVGEHLTHLSHAQTEAHMVAFSLSGAEDAVAVAMGACRGGEKDGKLFVDLPETGRIIGVVTGGRERAEQLIEQVVRHMGSSYPANRPITLKGGWVQVKPSEPARETIRRVWAAIGPLLPETEREEQ
ncbi:MAG: histidine kinase dimerization/phospho-acceptor domain-containing protein [Leptospirillia bacterium]